MSQIKMLDQHIADKIAAGEVVERPLSVVKELLENSLDAGADMIEITIKDGGVGLIKVKDNGAGISGEDLAMAFERHATSKIQEFNDLFSLHTFGFRGEALPSIAAVSQVEMTSCTEGENIGHTIRLAGGIVSEIKEIGAVNGTIVEVKNLFYNIPARRKFLKSNSYENGLIGELVSKYALGHPEVRFKLTVNTQVTIDTAGLSSTEERLAYFYGEAISTQIIVIPKTAYMPERYVEAWLIKEEVTRNNRNQEVFFVNGRLVKNIELNRLLEESYYTLVAKGRFPIAVVKFTLPGEQLDINIHPAKLEIKINDMDKMRPVLLDIFKDALWEASISKNAFLLSDQRLTAQMAQYDKQVHIASSSAAQTMACPAEVPERPVVQPLAKQTLLFPIDQPPTTPAQEKTMFKETHGFAGEALQVNETVATFPIQPPPSVKGEKQTSKTTMEMMPHSTSTTIKNIEQLTLMGQLNNSFIIAQNHEGLYIIDQHTCHERILYERFMEEENAKIIQTEDLLIPVTINLTPQQDSVLISHILTLRELGFVIETFGERSYLIRSLPLGLSAADDIEQMFIDLIDDFGSSKHINQATIKEKIIVTASCKGAVKARWKLTEIEMMTLLHDLAQIDNAHTCPHGRPIIYKISMKELYSIFKRGSYQYD